MTIRQSSGSCTPSFSSAELGRLACPKCGGALRVEWKLETTGPAMVAGVTLKIGAKYAPHLTCDECGFTEAGVRSNAEVSGPTGATRTPGYRAGTTGEK